MSIKPSAKGHTKNCTVSYTGKSVGISFIVRYCRLKRRELPKETNSTILVELALLNSDNRVTHNIKLISLSFGDIEWVITMIIEVQNHIKPTEDVVTNTIPTLRVGVTADDKKFHVPLSFILTIPDFDFAFQIASEVLHERERELTLKLIKECERMLLIASEPSDMRRPRRRVRGLKDSRWVNMVIEGLKKVMSEARLSGTGFSPENQNTSFVHSLLLVPSNVLIVKTRVLGLNRKMLHLKVLKSLSIGCSKSLTVIDELREIRTLSRSLGSLPNSKGSTDTRLGLSRIVPSGLRVASDLNVRRHSNLTEIILQLRETDRIGEEDVPLNVNLPSSRGLLHLPGDPSELRHLLDELSEELAGLCILRLLQSNWKEESS